jgi:hypothetical protein
MHQDEQSGSASTDSFSHGKVSQLHTVRCEQLASEQSASIVCILYSTCCLIRRLKCITFYSGRAHAISPPFFHSSHALPLLLCLEGKATQRQ